MFSPCVPWLAIGAFALFGVALTLWARFGTGGDE